MPTLPQEQIDEIEHEMADLVHENAELRKRIQGLEWAEVEIRRIKAAYPDLG